MNTQHQIAVWMDANHAFIITKDDNKFAVSANVEIENHDGAIYKNDRVEQSKDTHETKKYFKEIANHLSNVQDIYIFGPGQAQEQFKNFLEDYQNFNSKNISLGKSDKLSQSEMLEAVQAYFLA